VIDNFDGDAVFAKIVVHFFHLMEILMF
jgi:hypothetical protein